MGVMLKEDSDYRLAGQVAAEQALEAELGAGNQVITDYLYGRQQDQAHRR